MEATAIGIKVLGIVLQYGLLIFLLLFVYKAINFMAKDSKAIRTDIYTETEITVEEAVLTVLGAIDQRMIGRRFAFTEQISIGRSDDNDIVINDGYVSHHHAVITLYNNLYVIEDLGSRNRTLVNGQELEGRQYLQSGDMISVGTVVLQFGR